MFVLGKSVFRHLFFHNLHELWIDKLSQTNKCVTIGRDKFSRLLFTDDLVLLAFSKPGLQHAFAGFASACDITGMKISTSETKINLIKTK